MRELVLIVVFALWNGPSLASDLSSYAFVNDDGSLRIGGKTIHLYGIIIPPTERTCQSFISPVRCGSRAALALDFKIGANFVHCDVKGENADHSLVAICRVDDEDLATYLLQQGWVAASPDAPPEYVVLERIARHRGFGVWGIPVDRVLR
jgi:endonuclease YncB( thermonuclease family)